MSNPALPGGSQEDVDQGEQNYEDPVASRPSTASLPPPSQENSGSGAEYAEAVIRRGPENAIDMSMDWGNVYTLPSKGEKMKVSELKNVLIRGYLEKLGGRKQKDWQKRYCVLSGSLMYFYEKENSKTYNNCIALQAFTTSGAENLTHAKRSHFAFKMTHRDNTGKNKDYYFRTNSEDTREKWLKSIGKVVNSQSPSTPTSRPPSASTLPRHMPSQVTSSTFLPDPSSRKRASSLQEEGEEGELYEDMAIPEETEDLDEYVPVSPTPNQGEESGEEYVDVMTQNDIEQEEYEDTTNFQQPPPPLSPPPGPPSEFFTPPVVAQPQQVPPPKAPALVPPPSQDIPIDTNRIYDQPNGSAISLEKVFVSLWDFAASEEDELALSRGDLVYVSSPKETAEWWFGELLDPDASHKLGQVGFFPRTYSTAAFTPVA